MFEFVRIPRSLVAVIGALTLTGLIGCGGGEDPKPDAGSDLCADVTCASNEACNPENGQCEQRACDPACSGTAPVCDPATVTCVTCTATEGCGGDTPLCDTSANSGAGACVECTSDAQCDGATPYCANNICVTCTAAEGCTGQAVCDVEANGGRAACVGCVGNSDCMGGTPICNPVSQTCVGCLADAQCSGTTPACDSATNTCVGCNSNAHCSGATPVCDTTAQTCVTCRGDQDCSGETPVCDAAANGGAGACVGCVDNGDCSGATPTCNTATQSCVACLSDAQCGGATPACDTTTFTCVGCNSDAHCSGATPVCDTTSQTCATCREDAHCSGATPTCDAAANGGAGACVGCVDNGDCSGATPTCDTTTQTCVACLTDAQCGGATPACNPATNTCVACLNDAQCGGATPACDTLANTCVTCTGSGHCPAGTPVCDTAVAGGACVECLTNAQCGSGERCENQSCVVIPDTCATAAPIVFAAGQTVTTFPIDATGAANDYAGSCTSSSGRAEVVYHLNLTNAQDVKVDVTGASGFDAVFFLRAAPCETGGQLACVDNGSSGTETHTFENLQPGDYYLFVEAWGANAFQGSATVSLLPPTLPEPGQNCSAPIAITATEGSPAVFSLNTASATATNENVGSCYSSTSATSGREFVYALTLTQPQDLTVTAVGQGSVDPIVYIRSGACLSGTEVVCKDGSGQTEVANAFNLQPGTYFIFVEQWSTTQGIIDVTVAVHPPTLPPTNDTCATAQALALVPGTPTTVTTNTALAADDTAGSCVSTSNSREVVYSFTTTAAQDFNVVATGAAGVNPVLYLRSGDCGTGTQVACLNATSNGGTETLSLLNQPAGTYYLFVETVGTAVGAVELTVNLLPATAPPSNESCATPQTLTPTPGAPLQFTADTTQAADDETGTCVSTANSRELVYEFTTTAAQDFHFVATGATGVNPALYLRSGTCTGGTQLACVNASSSTGAAGAETIRLGNQPAGTYYLVVETVGSSFGQVDVTLDFLAPTTNDSCSAPAPLSVTPGTPTVFAADTRFATHVETGTCNSTANSRELVYTFTTTAEQDLTVTATGGSGVNPVLYLREGTCAGSQVACVNATSTNATETLIVPNLAAGTYFLFVETSGTSIGVVDVAINLDAPTTNQSCAAPQLLNVTPGTPLQFVTDTRYATDVESASCNTATNSRELVYTFTTSAAHDILVTATGPSGVNPVIYLRDGTCTNTMGQVCQNSSTGTGESFLSFDRQAGTYYLFVETVGSSAGPVTVSVSLNPPTPAAANDTCAAAQALTLPATLSGYTFNAAHDYSVNSSCGTASGPDVVYEVTTTTPGTLFARVTPRTAGYRPTVSVRALAQCTNATSPTTNGCMTAPAIDAAAELMVTELPAGTWYLVVDGNVPGNFDLQVTHSPFSADPNETCASAELLSFSNGLATIYGSTLGMADDHSVSCSSTASNITGDAVYRIAVPALQPGQTGYQAKVLARSVNFDEYTPAVSLRSNCADDTSASQGACSSASSSPFVASGFVTSEQTTGALVPGSDYFIVVDGSTSTSSKPGNGAYRLDVMMMPVPHPQDSCGGAANLPTNTSVQGMTVGATNAFSLSGGHYANASGSNVTTFGFNGPDVVYAWTAPATGPATVEVTPDPVWDVGFVVMSACAPNSAVAFADSFAGGRVETDTFQAVQGTTYYVVVDYFSSTSSVAGGFQLSISQ